MRKCPEYLSHIRTLACLSCKIKNRSQAHHLLRAGIRGMGMKSEDKHAVPLCKKCHDDLHRMGDEYTYFALQGVDAYEWSKNQWKFFQGSLSGS